MLGELYSAAFSGPAFNWICSPAVTELETIVLDWLAQILNLPACFMSSGQGGGVVHGSASEASLTVLVAARDRYLKHVTRHVPDEEKEAAMDQRRAKLVAIGGEMSHSSIQKAAMIAGTKYRVVPAYQEDGFSMTGHHLRSTLNRCRHDGLEPFYLVATLGTTATCTIDRFDEVAHVVQDWPTIWTHVDAAYAGAALVCEEYHHLTRHLEKFDSFVMNMHKWLLTNFDARSVTGPAHLFASPPLRLTTVHSCLFVQRRQPLIDALSVNPAYLKNQFSESGLVFDYRDWQIPFGRRFRALKMWFVLRTYGVQGLASSVRTHIELGEMFGRWIASRPDLFRILTGPAFALTTFYIVPYPNPSTVPADALSDPSTDPPRDAEAQAIIDSNALTKDVHDLIFSRRKLLITQTLVGGRSVLRVVSANPKTDEAHLRDAFKIIVDATEDVLRKRLGNDAVHRGRVIDGHVDADDDKNMVHPDVVRSRNR